MTTIRVTEKEREALNLYEQGLTASQIATQLRVPVSTLRSSWFRKYKGLGILAGSQKSQNVRVDWATLEALEKGGRKGAGKRDIKPVDVQDEAAHKAHPFKGDPGALDALRAHCETKGISLSEGLTRAIEAYLK